jgi:rSAM/selenodomain-associated transferase 2
LWRCVILINETLETRSLTPDANSGQNKISICIPTYNEEANIADLIEQCLSLSDNDSIEIIIADGGSLDHTQKIIQGFTAPAIKNSAVTLVTGAKGRAAQMNLAASHAKHNCLWFLHADSVIAQNLDISALQTLQTNQWGRFDVQLSGSHKAFRMIEFMINLRSALTSVSTGDQGLFIHKDLFEQVDGFADLALMEDVQLTKALRRHSKPINLTQKLVTSSRRWQQKGIVKTIILMWSLRFAYFCGVSPQRLATWYR